MSESVSVYQSGAHDGLLMGALLSLTFLLQAYGQGLPMLGAAGTLVMLAIPFVAYMMLRRGYRASGWTHTLSALWMHGITMFICGGLIMGLVMYVYMRLVNPAFIHDTFVTAAEAYRQMGTAESVQMADIIDRIIEERLLPSAITMTFTVIWAVSFGGAMLSLLLALIIRYCTRKSATQR